MPFDEESDKEQPSLKSQKVGLKNVSSQKSIFESMPKKPLPEEFEQKVKQVQERANGYKMKAADLASQFNKAMADKTLPQNKNMFQYEIEKELMQKMVQLAIDINNDPVEDEGMGSLTWITQLLKTCFSQRDRINKLEYAITLLDKKFDPNVMIDGLIVDKKAAEKLSAIISKEITKVLDNKKTSE